MARNTDQKGVCRRCTKSTTRGGMSRHLPACLGRGNHLLLAVGMPGGPYWMYVTAPPKARLGDLDRLLRDTWLECCGHLSAFEVGGERYEASIHRGYGRTGRSMSTPLAEAVPPGTAWTHMYDFGTTTMLAGRTVGLVAGAGRGLAITARNDDIAWPCASCEQRATTLCSVCWTMSCGCLQTCPECEEEFEEMGLPVVNSPRMGICGYGG